MSSEDRIKEPEIEEDTAREKNSENAGIDKTWRWRRVRAVSKLGLTPPGQRKNRKGSVIRWKMTKGGIKKRYQERKIISHGNTVILIDRGGDQ